MEVLKQDAIDYNPMPRFIKPNIEPHTEICNCSTCKNERFIEEIQDLSEEQFISLLCETLEGNEQGFGVENDLFYIEWLRPAEFQIAKAKRICEARGLKRAVGSRSIRINLSASVGYKNVPYLFMTGGN